MISNLNALNTISSIKECANKIMAIISKEALGLEKIQGLLSKISNETAEIVTQPTNLIDIGLGITIVFLLVRAGIWIHKYERDEPELN